MAFYAKYGIQFRDVNEKLYNVAIYKNTQLSPAPATIMLTPGDSPLVIDEDDSKEFYTPIRTQTGNLTICTKIDPQEAMPSGGTLDIADIMPMNNSDTPVMVTQYNEANNEWGIVWIGYLSSEAYNQPYTDVPYNIQLPINSVLEAWKGIYYGSNAKVVTIGYLMAELAMYTPLYSEILYPVWPQDCEDFWGLLINTTIFVKRTEYINEESILMTVEGKSLYDILETLCKFMGWTARESGVYIYLQKIQGVGVITGTEQRQMAALYWRGNDHQRSIVAGSKSVKITANLGEMEIDMKLPEFPLIDMLDPRDNQLADTHYVYTLPTTNSTVINYVTMRWRSGNIRLGYYYGDNERYSFSHNGNSNILNVISSSIAYDDSLGQNPSILAYNYPKNFYTIHAGAFYARMQIDNYNEHDLKHHKTKDGVYLSLFPAAWNGYVASGQNATIPIFEMRSVIAFAANEKGYFVLNAKFHKFWDMSAVNVVGGDQCRFVFELQVGDKYWGGSAWHNRTGQNQFCPAEVYNNDKFANNWNSSMDLDQVDGICIPTTELNPIGEVILRIYPETYRSNPWTDTDIDWRELVFGVFFEELSLVYYPSKSATRTDRNQNTYYKDLGTKFSDEETVDNDIVSWAHNNPSPSLLYKVSDVEGTEVTEPMQKLTYLKSDGTTEERRPETDLLNRMAEYYSKPRTILNLEVQHIDDKPLPLLRYVGLGDGKLYAPMSASRDFQLDKSKINFMELPAES